MKLGDGGGLSKNVNAWLCSMQNCAAILAYHSRVGCTVRYDVHLRRDPRQSPTV